MKIGNTIYFDHQASTPVATGVLEQMIPYFADFPGNPHSSDHFLGWEANKAIEKASAQVAKLIGSDPDEIVFTSGATESNNTALLGIGRRAAGRKRNRILISSIEHKCVIAAAEILEDQLGFEVVEIPVDARGHIRIPEFETLMDDDVLLVSIILVNNEIGTIQDIARISKIVGKYGALLHSDAAQAPMTMETSELAQVTDLLSLSSHKMYGPKGIGALYICREIQSEIEPLMYGGGQQRGLRSGTLPTPLCVGMGAAAQFIASSETKRERELLRQRTERFVDELRNLQYQIELNGPIGAERHIGNANIRFEGFIAKDILHVLQPNLAASTGSACTSGIDEPSHVLLAIGLSRSQAESSIRFSLGFGNNDDHVDEALSIIENALDRLTHSGIATTARY